VISQLWSQQRIRGQRLSIFTLNQTQIEDYYQETRRWSSYLKAKEKIAKDGPSLIFDRGKVIDKEHGLTSTTT
jgi:hypothetical protein